MIKRIELINFMSHEHTVIEPAAGLTVLIGPNNCGKSAIVSALQILCHNLPSTHVMRHGAKECQIIVETDDGHRIEWSRKKSGSPKYVIDGKEHDRLKGRVPDDLYRALRLPRIETGSGSDSLDVHFGEQSNPVFLLNDKGKNAAQFFASSSDASRLVSMQNLHKKRITDSKKEHKRLSSQRIQIGAALESLKPISKLETAIARSEIQYKKINEKAHAIEELRILIHAIDEVGSKTAQLTSFNQILGQAPDPPSFTDTKTLDSLANQLQAAEFEARRSAAEEKVLARLTEPPTLSPTQPIVEAVALLRSTNASFRSLTQRQAALDKLVEPPSVDVRIADLNALLERFNENQKDIQQIKELEKKVEASLKQTRELIASWADANPACPTCGSDVSTEKLLAGDHAHG